MRKLIGTFCFLVSIFATAADVAPLSLHPENSHYFLFRGKPTVLITSGEHYGAVLNPDFDYVKYLDTLQKDGLNLTRLFSGIYCESDKSFGISANTLAPAQNKLLGPWARSTQPGYKLGGNKFDLEKWDDVYFARLKDFMAQAAQRGIVVEFDPFCPFYEDSMWELSALNPANNVNNLPSLLRTDVWALKNEKMTAIEDAVTKKFVTELNGFDNFYFEICNEPYFGGVTLEWQKHIAELLVVTEKGLPFKHLIAQNIGNGNSKIQNPNPVVSIFNFHYAESKDPIEPNYALNKVMGDDETGFKGIADVTYRSQAWLYILSGGAVFDNLDYSFTVGHEAGDFPLPPKQPGGGGVKFREQMKVLKNFIHGFDLLKLAPNASILKVDPASAGAAQITARVLAEPGKQYAIYVHCGTQALMTLDAPAGNYTIDWIDTRSGASAKMETVKHSGGAMKLSSPPYTEDIALRILLVK